MTDTKHAPGSVSIKAALAIINSTVNPALRHDASNVTALHLAEIIERETHVTELLEIATCFLAWVDSGAKGWPSEEEFNVAAKKARAAVGTRKHIVHPSPQP